MSNKNRVLVNVVNRRRITKKVFYVKFQQIFLLKTILFKFAIEYVLAIQNKVVDSSSEIALSVSYTLLFKLFSVQRKKRRDLPVSRRWMIRFQITR